MLHRNTPELDQWETPGGKVKPGEEPTDAAVREVYEELGVNVRILHFLAETSFKQAGKDYHYTLFRGEVIGGVRPDVQEPDTHDALDYVNLGYLHIDLPYNLSPNALALMKLIQGGEVQL